MLSTIHKLFSGKQTTAEKSEEVEQQQYIQYAQEVECTLRLLEEHLHESDDSADINSHFITNLFSTFHSE